MLGALGDGGGSVLDVHGFFCAWAVVAVVVAERGRAIRGELEIVGILGWWVSELGLVLIQASRGVLERSETIS